MDHAQITVEAVAAVLTTAPFRRQHLGDEGRVCAVATAALSAAFGKVSNQYHVGGYWGMRSDIDVGNGSVGIEVKLADKLETAAGVQRLFGQAIYYSRRCYGANLLVLVVGTARQQSTPELAELADFLQSIGVRYLYVPTS